MIMIIGHDCYYYRQRHWIGIPIINTIININIVPVIVIAIIIAIAVIILIGINIYNTI